MAPSGVTPQDLIALDKSRVKPSDYVLNRHAPDEAEHEQ